MAKHAHTFVETHDGFLGFGMDRETDENTVQVYLQKFSDDELLKIMLKRMSDAELAEVFEMISKMLKIHFTEPEYHRYFLKDDV